MNSNSPILVTGAHRTGTTWVGKMLTAGGEVAYISEPLNVLHRPGVLCAPVSHWYTYICQDNEEEFLPALSETLRFRYHTWAEARTLRSRKDLLRMGRDWSTFAAGRLQKKRPLLKDPFAVFSLPWFAGRLGCEVVVTIRHPAAFASSLKRLEWPFQFEDLLAQPLLMRDLLEPFRAEMEASLLSPGDVLGQAALLWRIVYQCVWDFCQQFPQFQVVRHEDLSLAPAPGFQALYASLGLKFTPQAEKIILSSSSSENPKEVSRQAIYTTRLDSRANLDNWKRRLEPGEIARIRALTGDLAAAYYPDASWE